jgi:hypothetical protein
MKGEGKAGAVPRAVARPVPAVVTRIAEHRSRSAS